MKDLHSEKKMEDEIKHNWKNKPIYKPNNVKLFIAISYQKDFSDSICNWLRGRLHSRNTKKKKLNKKINACLWQEISSADTSGRNMIMMNKQRNNFLYQNKSREKIMNFKDHVKTLRKKRDREKCDTIKMQINNWTIDFFPIYLK